MENTLYDSLLIALMFGSGYLLSRILIKSGTAESLVFFFMRQSKGHISRIITYIVFLSVIISMVIPNTIAILMMLPLIEVLKLDIERLDGKKGSLTTALALASLYGANIGGLGFLIGSGSNVVLLTFLYVNRINGTEKINFLSWIGWGLPLALILASIASLVIITFLVPRDLRHAKLDFTHMHKHRKDFPHQKATIFLSMVFFVVWVTLSAIHLLDRHYDFPYILSIAIVFFLGFIGIAFFVTFNDTKLGVRSRLLNIKDIASGLPTKGLILTAVSITLAALLLAFRLDSRFLDFLGLTDFLANVAMKTRTLIIVSLALTTFTVFMSELLSNTAVSVAFFTVAVALCNSLNVPALPILIGISAAATVPSMSPIASPVNAMAFGGIKGVSIRKMLKVGFFMNLIVIVVVSFWAVVYIPWYYGLR